MTVHPLGLAFSAGKNVCGSCFWAKLKGPGPKVLRCAAAGYQRISPQWRGCANFEEEPECLDCGACCGPAYDAVEVSRRDPVRKKQPAWIEHVGGRYQVLRRADNHCQALRADNRCRIYADRPRCCRDFEVGEENCLFARRRLGFTKAWR